MDIEHSFFFLFKFFFFFGPIGFIDKIAENMDRKQDERERGSDLQQRDPVWELNPGPLQRGQIRPDIEHSTKNFHPIMIM